MADAAPSDRGEDTGAATGGEAVRLTLPADLRYLDVAIATIESLADRAGIDPREVAELRAGVQALLVDRISRTASAGLVLDYEVGDGFLGVRVLDAGVDGRTS